MHRSRSVLSSWWSAWLVQISWFSIRLWSPSRETLGRSRMLWHCVPYTLSLVSYGSFTRRGTRKSKGSNWGLRLSYKHCQMRRDQRKSCISTRLLSFPTHEPRTAHPPRSKSSPRPHQAKSSLRMQSSPSSWMTLEKPSKGARSMRPSNPRSRSASRCSLRPFRKALESSTPWFTLRLWIKT